MLSTPALYIKSEIELSMWGAGWLREGVAHVTYTLGLG